MFRAYPLKTVSCHAWSNTVIRLTGAIVTAGIILCGSSASADQVILDDLIVDGSIAVGMDAVNGESFGFDTIRLKENNLRIRAVDTSSTSSFPSNDWQITFNDSSNGGLNKFSIDDIDAGRTPFTIEAGAPSHSLYVDDSGRVGSGTGNPVVEYHMKDGDTPTVRLEQDGSSGFTPQTWDVAGNETNFFIRDATNGSTLPFRIRPGAPTSSIYIDASGDIGVGTSSPNGNIHIRRTIATTGHAMLRLEQTQAAAEVVLTVLDDGKVGIGTETPTLSQNHGGLHITNSNAGLRMQPTTDTGWGYIEYYDESNTGRFITGYHDSSQTYRVVGGTSLSGRNGIIVTFGGNVGIRNTNAAHVLEVGTDNTNGNGAHVTDGGVWTSASSREFKENIKSISSKEAYDAVRNLNPVKYNYKVEPDEQYAGFIAEDVPELVSTNSRKYLTSMDIVTVVTKVVQKQQRTIEEQQKTISKLNQRLEQLETSVQTQD